MAEQYRVPGQFQVPSMAEISYAAGNQQARENAQWKMFTDTLRAYTDINNANKLQSLRERQFVFDVERNQRDFDRGVTEFDRKLELEKKQQESASRVNDIQYDLNSFRLTKEQEAYDQLKQSFLAYPQLRTDIAAMLPNGGRMPASQWFEKRGEIMAKFGTDPSRSAVVREILSPYDAQNKAFSDTAVLSDQGKVLSWVRSGTYSVPEFDDKGNLTGYKPMLFNGKTAQDAFNEAKEAYNRDDLVTYEAIMEPLRQAGAIRDRVQQTTRTLVEGKEIEATTGVPVYQVRSSEKGGVEMVFQTPRVYGAKGGAGGAGETKTFSEADLKLLETQVQNINTELSNVDEQLANVDPADTVKSAPLRAKKAGLEAELKALDETYKMGVELVRQKGAGQLPTPKPGGQPPAGAPSRPTPQSILRKPVIPAPSPTAKSGSAVQQATEVSGNYFITPAGSTVTNPFTNIISPKKKPAPFLAPTEVAQVSR
ncbi:MAG: hypothetical protein EBT48_03130 [Verrucomicrobia bacterium]|nr:hypothetical protein [Verrucomicrobiota bacterium]